MKAAVVLPLLCLACAAQELKVYAIDVEGGKSTLYVSPSGQSMLIDAGFDGHHHRDPDRILAAVRDAGLQQIDYLVISHYHADHVGGVPRLAAKIPILNFVDHGQNFEAPKDAGGPYSQYLAAREKGRHITVKAGDRIPIDGMDVQVVTASGQAISRPLRGAGQPNPLCAAFRPMDPDRSENARSIGVVITFGKFRLVDLGDLYWNQERDLACPNNLIGAADVYMTTHHAKKTSGAPALVQSLHAKAAIMNNGATTGAAESHWRTIQESPGNPDIWQLHYAFGNPKRYNSPRKFIANLGGENGCEGNAIRLTAHSDGVFTIRNERTQLEKTYR